VDDEPFNLIALEGLLNVLGITKIEKAFNGREALDILEQNPTTFDAVLTDNNMPEMIGIQLAEHIRAMQQHK
jgi:CheY-like chemotaxis protein